MRFIPIIFLGVGLLSSTMWVPFVVGALWWDLAKTAFTEYRDGIDMPEDTLPEFVAVAGVVSPPHLSSRGRHGWVVTVPIKNSHPTRYTSYGAPGRPPLWMACETGGRVIVMGYDWMLGPDAMPVFPRIGPGQTVAVDFSTKLDWDYDPVNADEPMLGCKIGQSKGQAMRQLGVDPADWNRSRRSPEDR